MMVLLCFAVAGQHCDLLLCHHSGRHVILHGRPQTPQGLSGGPAVAGGEAQHGGTKSAAGERNNQTKPNQHEHVEFNAGQSVPSLEMQGLETRFLKAELLT